MTTAFPVPLTAMHRLSGVAIAVAGAVALVVLAAVVGQHHLGEPWRLFAYQAAALAVAAVVVLAVRRVVRTRLPRIGDLAAPARRLRLGARVGMGLGLGLSDISVVSDGPSWRGMGVRLTVVVVALTVTIAVITQHGQLVGTPAWVWAAAVLLAIPLSAMSALSEELVVRWAVVASMRGPWASAAPWVSGALSGCLHWFALPGGAIGALTAAALGWVLARSVQDTRGIGWAWLIHGCHDVVVFTAVVALMLG